MKSFVKTIIWSRQQSDIVQEESLFSWALPAIHSEYPVLNPISISDLYVSKNSVPFLPNAVRQWPDSKPTLTEDLNTIGIHSAGNATKKFFRLCPFQTTKDSVTILIRNSRIKAPVFEIRKRYDMRIGKVGSLSDYYPRWSGMSHHCLNAVGYIRNRVIRIGNGLKN